MGSLMDRRVRKIVDWVLGLVLIAAGIVGGFVPILQGWVLVLAGLAILSSHSRFAHRVYERVKTVGRGVKERIARRRGGRADGSAGDGSA